jgi:hypothetical protein
MHYGAIIANAIIVNDESMCSNLADFCENFLVWGRFLAFKNPVKYRCRFGINRNRSDV